MRPEPFYDGVLLYFLWAKKGGKKKERKIFFSAFQIHGSLHIIDELRSFLFSLVTVPAQMIAFFSFGTE